MLTKRYVSKAHFAKRLYLSKDAWLVFEISYCFFHSHIKNITDRFSFETHFECFAAIPFSFTGFTRHINVWKEFHFYQSKTGTFACLASAAFHIKRKPSRFIAPDF